MHDDQDPAEVIRRAMPDSQPPVSFDVDKAISDGYRFRRRNRLALGGASAAGVLAVAGAMALVIAPSPGDTDNPVDSAESADPTQTTEPAETVIEDPAMAGYQWIDSRGLEIDPETNAEYTEVFGPLLADAGLWDDPQNLQETDWCGEGEPGLEEDQEAQDCDPIPIGLQLSGNQRPGNYGQVWLRSFMSGENEEVGGAYGYLRSIFSIELLLPGGWTAEPGPVTEQLFPQHLISDGAYYTDEAPEFSSQELDDGRTLMIADHGCAYDLAVVYPNGTAMRVSWDVDCSGTTRPMELDKLTEAVLQAPESEFDTSALQPVDEVWDVPMGWLYDPEERWDSSDQVQDDAQTTYAAAREELRTVVPGATLGTGDPRNLGVGGRGATVQHSYGNSGTLPYETTVDETAMDVYFDLRYYLPGGWIPGYSEMDDRGPYLTVCKEEHECATVTDDDGTVWVIEDAVVNHEPGPEETWEPIVEHDVYVTRIDPDGWAVGTWSNWQGDIEGLDVELFTEILRALPAPTYDEDLEPVLPD